MTKWINRLFRPNRRPIVTRRPQPTRLGVESLEGRELPAITFSYSVGILTIKGDAADNRVELVGDAATISVSYSSGKGVVQKTLFGNVKKIEFDGGAGNDVFTNTTPVPSRAYSGAGDDTLTGGSGADDLNGDDGTDRLNGRDGDDRLSSGDGVMDVLLGGAGDDDLFDGDGRDILFGEEGSDSLFGSAGDDELYGGPGDDFLYGGAGNDNLYGGGGVNRLFGQGGDDFLYMTRSSGYADGGEGVDRYGDSGGSVGRTTQPVPKASLLRQGGRLGAALDGDTLSLTGTTGYGIRITGDWHRVANRDGSEVFTARGNLKLKTALGDLPLPANLTTISTAPDHWDSAGVVTGSASVRLPALNTADPANPLGGFARQYGLSLSTRGGSWGVKLGRDLSNVGTPLAPDVPYLYFTTQTDFSAGFGNATASPGPGKSLTVVLDPSDPYLFVRANEFTFGGSLHGNIPYTPARAPSALAGTNPIFGDVYTEGAFDLGSLPVNVAGKVVIDLDANDDGRSLALDKNSLRDLLTGHESFADFARAAPGDVALGVNGSAALSYTKAGFDFSLDADHGSLVYTPGQVAFRGHISNPFAGSRVDDYFAPSTGAVDGTLRKSASGGTDWSATWTTDVTIAGFRAPGAAITIGNAGLSVDAYVDLGHGLSMAHVKGRLNPNGNFTLTGSAKFDVDAGPGDIVGKATVTLQNYYGDARAEVGVSGGSDFLSNGYHAHVDLDKFGFTLRAGRSGVSVSGSGYAKAGIYLVGIRVAGIGAGFSIDSDGFSISLPYVPDLHVRW